jgi:succinate dehydrogenase / fumarate reductase, membrane anchor subunit
MATQTSTVTRMRSGSRFELYAWFFTRVTGILLLLMAAFSLVYANLVGGPSNLYAAAQMRWAFFPIPFHVQSTSVEVTPSFANPFWQVYSFLVITFAATHALNGLRVVLEDYIRRPLLMAWIRAALVGLWLCVLLAAIFLIFVFA